MEVSTAGSRGEMLEGLIQQGWVAHEDSEKWDLAKGSDELLIVQEVLGDGHWRLRVRLQTEDRYSIVMHDLEGLLD